MGILGSIKGGLKKGWDAYTEYAPGGQALNYFMGNDSRQQAAEEYAGMDPGGKLAGQADAAGAFAGVGEQGYADRTAALGGVTDQLGRLARGEDSYSAMQLRQALGQNLAAQQAMAAGARPGNAAMAARTAAMNQGRLSAGLAGQQALAGIAERQSAVQSLGNVLGSMRGQDLQAALGSRQNAMGGLGTLEGERGRRFEAVMGVPTQGEQMAGVAQGIGQMIAASDERGKEDVQEGGGRGFLEALSRGLWSGGGPNVPMGARWQAAQPQTGVSYSSGTGAMDAPPTRQAPARTMLDGLQDSTYRYRDPRAPGAAPGRQLGIMAQDLERSPMGRGAVMDTPAGKMVDTTRLAHALAAGAADLNDRVAELEAARRG